MHSLVATANRASIVTLAALFAGCSNTASTLQAVPLSPPAPAQSFAHHLGGHDDTVQLAYVVNYSSNNVSAFAIDATSGALTPLKGSPFKVGGGPYGIAVDPTGTFVYVANFNSNNISGYTIDTVSGSLKRVKGSPFAAGSEASSVTIDPTGRFAYVANFGANDVSAYRIATSGALTPLTGSPFKVGRAPYTVAIDPTGKFAYVPNAGSNDVSAYAIDSASGALTPVKGSPFRAGITPVSMTVDPTGKFAYAASYWSDNISGYAIDRTSGALRSLPGSPFANPGAGPFDVVVSPTGMFAYVPNSGNPPYLSNVSAYTIDSTRGTLTPVAGSPFANSGFGPLSGTVDATSKFAYFVNYMTNNISAYTIGAGGALKKVKGSPFAAGTYPSQMAVCSVSARKCIPPPL